MFLKLGLVFHLPTFGKAWPLCLACIATAPEVQSTIILYPSVYLLRPCLLVFSQQQFEVGICCPVNLRLLGLLVFLNQNSEGFCLILIEHSWFNVMIHCYFVATFLRNLVLSSFFLYGYLYTIVIAYTPDLNGNKSLIWLIELSTEKCLSYNCTVILYRLLSLWNKFEIWTSGTNPTRASPFESPKGYILKIETINAIEAYYVRWWGCEKPLKARIEKLT